VNFLTDTIAEEIYLAGERVPAGRYCEIDTKREVLLDHAGHLPASLDGRVAAYVCIQNHWEHAPRTGNKAQAA